MKILATLGWIVLGVIVGVIITCCFSSSGYVDKLQEAYDLGYEKGVQEGKVKKDE